MPIRPNDGGAGLKPVVGGFHPSLGPSSASFGVNDSGVIAITGLDTLETLVSVSGRASISGASIIVPTALSSSGTYVVTTSLDRQIAIAVTISLLPSTILTFGGDPLTLAGDYLTYGAAAA